MSKTVGIDPGTTNSCMAVMEDGKPVVILDSEGARAIPSVVTSTKADECLVGESVKHRAVMNADRTIASIKRHMGTSYKAMIDGGSYTPQETSAMTLQKLKADAESYLDEEASEAVITVPVYLNDAQRQATKDAGKIAGLEVKRIINKPTAMALVCGLDNDKEQRIIVYDLGGGTFDVPTINIGEGVIEVLATNGDTHLGGDNSDNKITEWMITEFKKQVGIDPGNGKMVLQRPKEATEKARKELSAATTAEISLPFIMATAEGLQHLAMTLAHAKFNELTVDLIERTVIPVQNAMHDAGITNADLGKVFPVGGSTRMLDAQEKVKQLTDMEPSKVLDPDECVTIDAAVQGGEFAGDSSTNDVLPLNVTPLFLSTETMDGTATKLVGRNTTIPTRKGWASSTTEDNQLTVDIHMAQGEREFARDNKSLGQFRLDGILPAKRGVPQVEITFDIDANGIANASAKDLGTGKEQHTTITSGSNMSQENIDRTVKEASRFETQDGKRREVTDERNDVDSLIFQTEKAIQEVGEKLSGNDKAAVEADLSALKKAVNHTPAESITDEQVADIRVNKEKLMINTQQLFQKVYKNVQQGQAGRGAADNDNSKSGDGVVDDDFEEV